MATEMRASVLLTLKDDLTGKAKAAAKGLDEIGAAAKKVNGTTGLDKAAAEAGKVAASAERAAGAMARLGAAASSAGAQVGSALTAGAARIESAYASAASRAKASLSSIGAAAATAASHAVNHVAAAAPALYDERRRARDERREAYRLRPLATAQAEYDAAKSGAIPAIVGGVGIGVLAEQGNKLLRLKQNMAAAGATEHEVREAEKKAWELAAKHRNMSPATNLEIMNDARGVFGSQHDATHHVEPFVRAGSFLAAYANGKHAGGTHELIAELTAAMKSSEIAGKIDPKEMAGHVDQLVAMKVAFGDQVKIKDYLVAQRQAGVALRNADDDFRYGYFAALVQENGPSAGQMAMTSFNKIVAGVGNRGYAVEAMDQLGLIDRTKTNAIKTDKSGKIVGVKDAEAIVGSKTAGVNFPKWVWETLKPRLAEATKGYTGTDKAVRESQLISKMFPDRNVAKFVTELLQQETKLKKDAALMKMVIKDKQNYEYESYNFQKQAVAAQAEGLLQHLGEPVTPLATAAMRKGAGWMSRFNEWWERGRDEHGHLGGAQQAVGYGAAGVVGAAGLAGTLAVLRTGGRLLGYKMLAGIPTLFEAAVATIGAGVAGARWLAAGAPRAAALAGMAGRATGWGALLVTGYELVTHWEGVKARVATIWDDIKALYAAKTGDERKAASDKLMADAKAAARAAKEATGLQAGAEFLAGEKGADGRYDWGYAGKAWDWVNSKLFGAKAQDEAHARAQAGMGMRPDLDAARQLEPQAADFAAPFRFADAAQVEAARAAATVDTAPGASAGGAGLAEKAFAFVKGLFAEAAAAFGNGAMRGAVAAGAGMLALGANGYDPTTAAAARMTQAEDVAATDQAATAAAGASPAIMGAATAPITIQAQGPQVTFNQAPPNISISVTVNATTNASPDAIGGAVASQVSSSLRGALHDGGN